MQCPISSSNYSKELPIFRISLLFSGSVYFLLGGMPYEQDTPERFDGGDIHMA